MSIQSLRAEGLPGLTMRYEDGGQVLVYIMNGKEVRLAPTATAEDIKAAFKEIE